MKEKLLVLVRMPIAFLVPCFALQQFVSILKGNRVDMLVLEKDFIEGKFTPFEQQKGK